MLVSFVKSLLKGFACAVYLKLSDENYILIDFAVIF